MAGLMACAQSASPGPLAVTAPASVWQWKDEHVNGLRFEGVTFDPKDKLLSNLEQKAGEPLDPTKVRDTMRRLFSSGRYRDISLRGVREAGGVTLIFVGTPRYFVGRVTIAGVKDERLASLLQFATNLNPGTAFADDAISAGTAGIVETLKQAGYYQPQVSEKTTIDVAGNQEDVVYTVVLGPQARIGDVTLAGNDPGMTVAEFRKKGKLKVNSKVTRDTTSNALSRLRTQYQKKDHLEATVTLQSQAYDNGRKQVDYGFSANQGPEVQVAVEGAKVSKSRLHLLVPIFEEGAIDNDLLNEGLYNLREYMEQQGYFDATATVKVTGAEKTAEKVIFSIDKGVKHKVLEVGLKGNKYFQDNLIKDRLKVQKADAYQRSGRYSQSLLTADVTSIQALYRANGFDQTKVTPEVKDVDKNDSGGDLKVGQIRVIYNIVEGPQQKFGTVQLAGVPAGRAKDITPLLNAQTGQPYSLLTLSGDRDAVLGYYLSHGFDQARVEIKQVKESEDAAKTDVTLNVTEGPQVTIDKVLLSGVVHTKTSVIEKQVKVKAGDPLNQSALLETQRNLYNLSLFNEVEAAVQNPDGETPSKNVLLQLTEAKRWDVTYGFGFEAQTGTPGVGPGGNQGDTAAQNGKAGASPRVSLDVSRANLRGTTQSLTLHATYGLLEKVATISFINPQLLGKPHLTATISAGYSNVQNITTFASSTSQADFRVTQKVKKADTFIYDFQYRRVSVDPNSLEITPNLIPQLSEPVRVGGPAVTYFHDTRQPSPLDAVKGRYFSIQEFVASSKFGSQADFNKTDISYSTYYAFGKRRYVLARNTRIGFENSYGVNENASLINCAGDLLNSNATCNSVPLPERLYAGGATSLRGFGINGAGPRDLTTGYPVGGSAVVVNTLELRLPPPTLPLVGSSISFVIFHDMGNVFQHPADMFRSIKNFQQPNIQTCKDVTLPPGVEQQDGVGVCDFRNYSHDVGLGIRYKTPVGPIRVDFSYNLNPPTYPVFYDYTTSLPYVGHAPHFNFFFSIGQSF